MPNVSVVWLDPGPSLGRIDSVSRQFILEEGSLEDGQEVRIQMSKKRNSKAKVWRAKVVNLSEQDIRPREPRKKKKANDQEPPAHIRASMQKMQDDDFQFMIGEAPTCHHKGQEKDNDKNSKPKEDGHEEEAERARRKQEEWKLEAMRQQEEEHSKRLERWRKEEEEWKNWKLKRLRDEKEMEEEFQRKKQRLEDELFQLEEECGEARLNNSVELFSPHKSPGQQPPVTVNIGYSPKTTTVHTTPVGQSQPSVVINCFFFFLLFFNLIYNFFNSQFFFNRLTSHIECPKWKMQ